LAGGVAHDFNNLLTVINGYAELLAATAPEQGGEEIAQIRHAGRRAASLTSQLLAYSGRRPADQTTFDVNVVVHETEQLLRRLLGPDMVLTVSPADEPAWVAGDAAQFDRALVNLVVNARDAMPGGGTLRISTRVVSASDDDVPAPYGRVVVVAVADTGLGMTADVRARLFEPFFTTKEIGKGTGLGLAVVDGFVRSHNGAVRVQSEPGSGSVFSLVLPWAQHGQAPRHGEAPTSVEGGAETVLVVDDEAAIRALVGSALERYGYKVLVAATGDDALALAEVTPGIDLLITDVAMAGMTGTVLAQAMQDRFPAMRVLYMSGYGADEVLRRGGAEHKGAILQKPFTLAGLAEKVREAVEA
jgi:CheY-like chemotaxis protein